MIDLPDRSATKELRHELAHHARLAAIGGGVDHLRLRTLGDKIGEAKGLASGAKAKRLQQAQELISGILASTGDVTPNDFTALGNLLRDDD